MATESVRPAPARRSGRERLVRYLVRRLGQAALTLVAIVILNFVILHLAPGDAIDVLAGEAGGGTPEYVEQLRHAYGLDQPIYVQMVRYLVNAAQLNFGFSFRNNMSVVDLIMSRLPATLLLMTASILLSFTLGVLLGVFAARRVNSFADNAISVLALLCYATPLFWFGLMAIVLFTVKLNLLPGNGMYTIAANYDWFEATLDVGRHLVLPACSLALFHMAVYTRLMRSSMLEIYGLDYIRTARAKGLSQRRIAFRHVLPNAILPMVTMLGLQIGALLGGAVLVETVFGWPGLGRLAFDAILQRDHNLLIGILLFGSALVIVANLVTDLVYAWLDPRIEVA
ncbi:MAG TPA: ABC transporter permease [Alphaproteobacteria bacterium]